ncbi:cytochrome P450 [Xylariomycetidae sp. FL2044]|nr:cytochrome P450 [Xylariomycetidae sp. FL2044]
MLDTLLVTLSLGAWLLYYSWRRRQLQRRQDVFARDHNCLPAPDASRWDPVLGLRHTFGIASAKRDGRHLENFHHNMFGKYGNTFSMLIMGQRVLMTNEPRNLQAILANQFTDFIIGQRRQDVFRDFLGIGIFNANGEAWAHARATIRPNLARNTFTDVALFEKHLQIRKLSPPTLILVSSLLTGLIHKTLDVGTELLCDKSVETLHPQGARLGHRFGWAIDTASDVIMMRMQLGKLWRLYTRHKNREACQVLKDYVDSMVHEAVERAKLDRQAGDNFVEDDPRYTFLGALARQGLGVDEIRSHVLNMLYAARASTASLISSVFRLLAADARVQRRLRNEIWNHLSGRLPTYEDVRSISYLNWVLKETLRLYPPVPQNIKAAAKDTMLPVGGGADGSAPIFVPKGTEIGFLVYSTHRRTDIWGDDAEDFRPERWDNLGPTFQYLPFNGGPRICPGESAVEHSLVHLSSHQWRQD